MRQLPSSDLAGSSDREEPVMLRWAGARALADRVAAEKTVEATEPMPTRACALRRRGLVRHPPLVRNVPWLHIAEALPFAPPVRDGFVW